MWTLVWPKMVAVLEVSQSRSHGMATSDDSVAALCALVAHKQNVSKQAHGAYTHEISSGLPQIHSVDSYAYLSSLS